MYVRTEKVVNIPHGYFCCKCTACKKDSYAKGKEYHYCDNDGGMLGMSKDGRVIKSLKCFENIRKELMR